MKTKQKITWTDLNSATSAELRKTYKLTDRQLEQQVRGHLYGANRNEMKKLYEQTYAKRR